MNILHFKENKIDEKEHCKALEDYINKSLMHEKMTEKHRENVARKEAKDNVGKTHPTLGKCVAKIPARDYFRLVAKYGKDTVLSKEFLQYFNKKHKDHSPIKA